MKHPEKVQRPKKVLLVDDEPEFLDVTRNCLVSLGAEFHLAGSGAEALEIVRTQTPDAILSDINMPGMDGMALLAALRDQGYETPFVLLTGYADRQRTVEALRLDAFDFLEKPIAWPHLTHVMHLAMEYGVLLRNLDAELESLPLGAVDSPDRIATYRQMQRHLLLMRKKRAAFGVVSKKVAG